MPGEVWRRSCWAGRCYLCSYLLDQEAVVEGLWFWCLFKFCTVRTAAVHGERGKQALYSHSDVSTWSKDISGQCNKQASKWIPQAIYHEWDTQAELSAALLERKIAPWQLVCQCQGGSLIYWRLEIAASGGNKDHGYLLGHQPISRACCALYWMVLVVLRGGRARLVHAVLNIPFSRMTLEICPDGVLHLYLQCTN